MSRLSSLAHSALFLAQLLGFSFPVLAGLLSGVLGCWYGLCHGLFAQGISAVPIRALAFAGFIVRASAGVRDLRCRAQRGRAGQKTKPFATMPDQACPDPHYPRP